MQLWAARWVWVQSWASMRFHQHKPLATSALNDFILRTCAHCVRWIRANTSRTSQFLAVGCETHVWMFSSCGQDPKPTQRERLLLSSFTCDSFWMQAHRWRQRISTASTEAGLADVDWKVWLSKLVGLHIPSSYLWFMDRALAEDEWLFKFELFRLFRGLAQTLHKRNQCNPSNHCPTCTGALATEWLCVSQYFGNTNCLKRAFFSCLALRSFDHTIHSVYGSSDGYGWSAESYECCVVCADPLNFFLKCRWLGWVLIQPLSFWPLLVPRWIYHLLCIS